MLGAEAPRRSERRMRSVTHPLVSLRSPLPLMVAAIGVAILVIAVVTLPPRPTPPDPSQIATLADDRQVIQVLEQFLVVLNRQNDGGLLAFFVRQVLQSLSHRLKLLSKIPALGSFACAGFSNFTPRF